MYDYLHIFQENLVDKTKIEEMLQEIVKSGVDMSHLYRTPTKLVVSPHFLKMAEGIFEANNNHEIKVDFNE